VNERPKAKMTPEQARAVESWLTDLMEMTESSGKHEGHTLRQVGRCVYCSCGSRYQGSLPAKGKP
jgi:hypothetical protein